MQLKAFQRLPDNVTVRYHPILFAGLLNAWGQKGPAEIAQKRLQTYRYCAWQAKRRGIAFRMPATHPFNPLPLLRLTLALGTMPQHITQIFDFVFAEGGNVHDLSERKVLYARLGVSNGEQLGTSDAIKMQLRIETQAAIDAGVYGVPTFAIDGELFWGDDCTDLVLEVLADPEMLQRDELGRVADLQMGVTRTARGPTTRAPD